MNMDATFVYNVDAGHAALGLGAGACAPEPPPPRLAEDRPPHAGIAPSTLAMPGLFPGRVVEVFHPEAIVRRRISEPAVRAMVDAGMESLTGDPPRRTPGRDSFPTTSSPSRSIRRVPGTVTSMALVREVIRALIASAFRKRAHRLRPQLESARGQRLPRPGAGRRARGRPRSALGGRRATTNRAGYDPRRIARWTASASGKPARISRASSQGRRQDHQPPCLKEHNASGVTGCLKNLAYGSFNNVARTHESPKTYTDPVIAVMCSVAPLR